MKNSIFLILFSLLFGACQDLVSSEFLEMTGAIQETSFETPDSLWVNNAEITRLLSVIKPKTHLDFTRVEESYDISTLNDSKGQPAVYIVNYANDKGFVVISARKTFDPLLAYSASGNLRPVETTGYLKSWLDGMVIANEQSEELFPDSVPVYKERWRVFESSCGQINDNVSRALEHEEFLELQSIFQPILGKWASNGWEYYDVATFADMSSENRWVLDYEGGIYPEYIEDFTRLSFVVRPPATAEHDMDNSNPCVWDQSAPYNKYFPEVGKDTVAAVGCKVISLAIVMKAYSWPASYNWSNISYYESSDELCRLLADIASNAGAIYGTSTGLGAQNAKRYLESVGYKASLSEPFDNSKFLSSKSPAIIGAKVYIGDKDEGNHSFVMYPSGHYITYTQYTELWSFPARKIFQKVDWTSQTSYGGPFYYVRWGWGGRGDGYYRSVTSVTPFQFTKCEPLSVLYDIQPK